MPKIITEDMIEKAAIELLVDPQYGYSHIDCYTKNEENLEDGTGRANKKQMVLPQVLFAKLCELNPQIPTEVIARTAEELSRNLYGDPLSDNFDRYQKIRHGEKVEYKNAAGVKALINIADNIGVHHSGFGSGDNVIFFAGG